MNVRRTSFVVMMVAALISVDIVTERMTVQMAPMNMTVVRNNTCNVAFLCLCTLFFLRFWKWKVFLFNFTVSSMPDVQLDVDCSCINL